MRSLIAFPFSLLPLLAYVAVATGTLPTQGGIDAELWTFALISGGTVSISAGDALVAFGVVMLFLEAVKATATGFGSALDHAFSVLAAVIYLILFLVWAPAASAVFAILMLIAFVDVLAGLWISLNVARRDLAIAPGGSF